MQNYLAPSTSLRQFSDSQQVTTSKSHFPYRVFNSFYCFGCTALPERSEELKNLMNEFDETDKSEIMNREQLQNQIDELSKDDPFYSILTKKQSPMLTWKVVKTHGKKIGHLQITLNSRTMKM